MSNITNEKTERNIAFLTENHHRLKWYDRIMVPVAILIYRVFGPKYNPEDGE